MCVYTLLHKRPWLLNATLMPTPVLCMLSISFSFFLKKKQGGAPRICIFGTLFVHLERCNDIFRSIRKGNADGVYYLTERQENTDVVQGANPTQLISGEETELIARAGCVTCVRVCVRPPIFQHLLLLAQVQELEGESQPLRRRSRQQ